MAQAERYHYGITWVPSGAHGFTQQLPFVTPQREGAVEEVPRGEGPGHRREMGSRSLDVNRETCEADRPYSEVLTVRDPRR